MRSFNTSKMKLNSLVQHIQQVATSQVKIMSTMTSMPSPTHKKHVQSFIGMIHYLAKFSQRLFKLAETIRELSKDKVPFNWGPEHQQAFVQIRKEITMLLFSLIITPRSKLLLCRQMPASKVLVHVYYKIQNQCIL